jgi:hypothetical protein
LKFIVAIFATFLFIAGPASAQDCSLSVTASGGALTGSLNYPCSVPFPDGTVLNVTAPTTLTIGTGSTLGFASNEPGRLYWEAINNGGTVALGTEKASTRTQIYGIDEENPQTSLACNACSTANLPGVIYSTAAISNALIHVIDYSTWESGMVTAGSWTPPTVTRLRLPGTPMPGRPTGRGAAGNCAAGTTTSTGEISFVPTSATVTFAPSSAANFVSIMYDGEQGLSSGVDSVDTAILRGGTQVGSARNSWAGGVLYVSVPIARTVLDFPQTTAATVWTVGLRQTGTARLSSTVIFGARTGDSYCAMNAVEIAG